MPTLHILSTGSQVLPSPQVQLLQLSPALHLGCEGTKQGGSLVLQLSPNQLSPNLHLGCECRRQGGSLECSSVETAGDVSNPGPQPAPTHPPTPIHPPTLQSLVPLRSQGWSVAHEHALSPVQTSVGLVHLGLHFMSPLKSHAMLSPVQVHAALAPLQVWLTVHLGCNEVRVPGVCERTQLRGSAQTKSAPPPPPTTHPHTHTLAQATQNHSTSWPVR